MQTTLNDKYDLVTDIPVRLTFSQPLEHAALVFVCPFSTTSTDILARSQTPLILVIMGKVKHDSSLDTFLLTQCNLDIPQALVSVPKSRAPLVLFVPRQPSTIVAVANIRYRFPLHLSLEYAWFAFASSLAVRTLIICQHGIALDNADSIQTLCDFAAQGASIPLVEPTNSSTSLWMGSHIAYHATKTSLWIHKRPVMVFDTIMGNANTDIFPLSAWNKNLLSRHILRSASTVFHPCDPKFAQLTSVWPTFRTP